MPTPVGLTLYEDNDEIIDLTITGAAGDDLSVVTAVEVVIKPDVCESDDDDDALVLSSDDAAEITINTQTSTEITATAYVPASALALPYPRVWRADALVGSLRRTAMYGPVTVVDL